MKKIILLIVSGLLIACMAGAALAKPSQMIISPAGGINYNPTNGGSATIKIWDIDWAAKSNNHHIRRATVTPQEANLEARLVVKVAGGTTIASNWASLGNPKFIDYNTLYNNYNDLSPVGTFDTLDEVSYKVEVRGTASGEIEIVDQFKDPINQNTNSGWDRSSATPTAHVPEFPTVALPVAGVLGLLFVFGRKKEGL